MNHENENQSEVAIKMKHFKKAVENGELDHLNYGMPAAIRVERQLRSLADAALQHDATDDRELQLLQSVIGMIHTLIHEGRVKDLYDLLEERYPEYYITSSMQGQSA